MKVNLNGHHINIKEYLIMYRNSWEGEPKFLLR